MTTKLNLIFLGTIFGCHYEHSIFLKLLKRKKYSNGFNYISPKYIYIYIGLTIAVISITKYESGKLVATRMKQSQQKCKHRNYRYI